MILFVLRNTVIRLLIFKDFQAVKNLYLIICADNASSFASVYKD